MNKENHFRYIIRSLPQGEALIGQEIEKRLLAKLASSGGTCANTLWELAIFYQKTGQFDQATQYIHRVRELIDDPEDIASAYLAFGQLEESKGDFQAAVKYYGKALRLEPCDRQTWYLIHNNLGYSLNQIGESGSAIPYLQRAIEIDPKRPNAYKNLGLSHVNLGHLEIAVELFIQATQVNASDPRALNHLISLIEANPALEVDMPNLSERVVNCKKTVEVAKNRQPDFEAHWAKLRAGNQAV